MIRRLLTLIAVVLCLLVGNCRLVEAKKQRNAPHEHKVRASELMLVTDTDDQCIVKTFTSFFHHIIISFDTQGKLPPYSPGPFDVLKLGPKDEEALSQDKAVMKQIPGEGGKGNEGGRAICIQDVNAPKDAVWNQILDLDHYVGKVNKLKECKNYFVKKNKDGTSTIKTKMVVGVIPGYSVSVETDRTTFNRANNCARL